MATIQNLSLVNLYHNPNNPRQEIGEVSELSSSICVMGILQNLTVVPYDDQIHKGLTVQDPDNAYVVLIGNRRLAAGKEAGIAEAPCQIMYGLDAAEQMKIMLVENMQRKDLTPVEEAYGFRQLSFDLGMSVEDIAKQTGISVATVRSRIKMSEMDRSKLEEAEKRGGTLSDYAELAKIKDLELRNKVLESIGTKNFQYELRAAKDKEKNEGAIAKRDKVLRTFTTEIPAKEDDMICVEQYYSCTPDKEVKIPQDADTVNYFLVFGANGTRYVYRRKTEAEKQSDCSAGIICAKCKENAAQLSAIHTRMKELRNAFIADFTPAKAKAYFPDIAAYAASMTMAAACSCSYNYVQKNTFAKGFHRYLGVKLDETGCYEQTDLTQAIQSQPEYAMLVIAYLIGEHKTNGKYFNENTWDGKISAYPPYYKVNDSLDALYFFLEKIGYVMSTEENDIQNGSHELFFTEERAAGWVAAETTAGTSEATATAASA